MLGAIEGRFGIKVEELPADHEAWDIEAHYLSHSAMAYTIFLSPSCIVFGGGAMNQPHSNEKFALNLKTFK